MLVETERRILMETLYTFMPLLLLIFIMYFLLIRPQKKREKQVNAMRSSIKVGDQIITIGGIYGTVVRLRDEQLVIQVGSDKTKLEITRWAVSKVITDEPMAARTPKTKKDAEPAKEETEEAQKKSKPKRLDKAKAEDAGAPVESVEESVIEPVEETVEGIEEEAKE
jgi:preprotein translocase subunit YajC